VAEGTVLAAYGVGADGARIQLETGTQYFDQKPVTFLVSAGALPDVAGLPVNDAIALLGTKNVTATALPDLQFNNDVASGSVISMQTTSDAPVAPGDTVNLVVSKGPDLVVIPDVVGETIPDATQMLTEAGFTVKLVTNVPKPFQDRAEVQSIRPDDDEALRGSEITIVSNY
jgi:beta-lactam-binding protein with PASTA domain